LVSGCTLILGYIKGQVLLLQPREIFMSDAKLNMYLLIPVLLMTISGFVMSSDDHEISRSLVQEGKILPLQQILAKINSNQSGRVLEVELEHERDRYIYDIELLAEDGKVWEYEVDAASGEVIGKELED
jgi:hypothetical protein